MQDIVGVFVFEKADTVQILLRWMAAGGHGTWILNKFGVWRSGFWCNVFNCSVMFIICFFFLKIKESCILVLL